MDKVPVQVLPNQVFTFTKNKIDYVGAIWLIAKLDGYSKAELGIFFRDPFQLFKQQFLKKI